MLYNILLVDDEKYTLEDIEHSLNKKELSISNIYSCMNITRAREILSEERIDIVVSDIDMPGGSGLALVAYIREHYASMPCILVTCHANFSYAQEGIRLHIQDYILKPIDYTVLSRQILAAEESLEKIWAEQSGHADLHHHTSRLKTEHQNDKVAADQYIEDAVAFIKEHLTSNVNREMVAESVHISPDHLDRIFREVYGLSVYKYITARKIDLAEDLLTNTNLSISSISNDLGFSNMSNFALAFRKAKGVTPNEYRKNVSGS